jgi:hypothetical protein
MYPIVIIVFVAEIITLASGSRLFILSNKSSPENYSFIF